MQSDMYYDAVIAGCGVAGLYTALNLPDTMRILMVCKGDMEECDSMLAQGGICVLPDEEDYTSYFEDTMRAGHYENNRESVDIMIRQSRPIIEELLRLGVRFEQNEDGSLRYAREGGHSRARICFHKDITGKEITTALQKHVRSCSNITVMEHARMCDLLVEHGVCKGIALETKEQQVVHVHAEDTVLATGGIGGLYEHSTNYPSLTGDALRICKKHGIQLDHLDYVQIHPTTLYSKKPGRRFLISESVRGEGAVLYNKEGKRFVDELLPRDVVTKAIQEQMEKDHTEFVWLSMEHISEETIRKHFPHIYQQCLEEGYDATKEWVPVVPAQHYFMGGIWVDSDSLTSMEHLYAAGETSCNGVHGANRLASNSLLESLVFAKRAAKKIGANR